MSTEKTACILCSRNCGLQVEINDGKFVKIQGDEKHPISKGKSFAIVGGGGQGNHLGGIYSRQRLSAMDSKFIYTALARKSSANQKREASTPLSKLMKASAEKW